MGYCRIKDPTPAGEGTRHPSGRLTKIYMLPKPIECKSSQGLIFSSLTLFMTQEAAPAAKTNY